MRSEEALRAEYFPRLTYAPELYCIKYSWKNWKDSEKHNYNIPAGKINKLYLPTIREFLVFFKRNAISLHLKMEKHHLSHDILKNGKIIGYFAYIFPLSDIMINTQTEDEFLDALSKKWNCEKDATIINYIKGLDDFRRAIYLSKTS